ncbi:unnamed protein product [Bodo saltans]|uniref:Uncharacterized protein n=1 Tax=Bodo saltans TaxID=75058 RepID=A0A0S4J718_BODSA|nr:unnamed protein product [Bodo saltans]|eukprot:CUG76005.1 unnamed protein product [Bodo saltans]
MAGERNEDLHEEQGASHHDEGSTRSTEKNAGDRHRGEHDGNADQDMLPSWQPTPSCPHAMDSNRAVDRDVPYAQDKSSQHLRQHRTEWHEFQSQAEDISIDVEGRYICLQRTGSGDFEKEASQKWHTTTQLQKGWHPGAVSQQNPAGPHKSTDQAHDGWTAPRILRHDPNLAATPNYFYRSQVAGLGGIGYDYDDLGLFIVSEGRVLKRAKRERHATKEGMRQSGKKLPLYAPNLPLLNTTLILELALGARRQVGVDREKRKK